MSRRARIFGILLFNVGAAACGDSGSQQATVEGPRHAVSREPVVRIGGNDERYEHQLRYAEAALRLSDGRIVVADVGSSEVRYFDAQDERLTILGGPGDGPGEFRRLRTIVRMRGDTVAAWDAILRRMSVFSPEGELSSTYSVPSLDAVINSFQERILASLVVSGMVYPLSNDRILVEPFVEPVSWPQEGVVQDTLWYALLDRSAEQWIELGPFAASEHFAHGGSIGPLPFGGSLRLAVGDTLISLASTYDTEVRMIAAEAGEIVGAIDLPIRRRLVTSEDIELYKNRFLGRSFLPGDRERTAARIDAVPWRSEFPVFSDLRIGSDGNLWVQAYESPTDSVQAWTVLTPSGELLARFTLDSAAQLMDGGLDYVLVRVRDELDVEEIRLYELVPRS